MTYIIPFFWSWTTMSNESMIDIEFDISKLETRAKWIEQAKNNGINNRGMFP